ncbi:sulfotransferase family protein [Alcanivorax sp.]|uniref:sulfotransferase family protein n=1 Tax=Alcanivorax sp. TaxID=1872427 RepID=UPI003BAAB70F
MIIKYRVVHRVSLKEALVIYSRLIVRKFEDLFASPVITNKKTLLVAGCGHSGTTLLAAKLGNHPNIFAVGRETEFLLPDKNSLVTASKLLSEWAYCAEYLGKEYVLEKTPKHIYFLKRADLIAPNNKVLLTIRNPLDNIASLYKRFGGLDLSIERWINDNRIVAGLAGSENIHIIRYEDLTADPEGTFSSLFRFIGDSFDPVILEEGETAYDSAVLKGNMVVRRDQVKSRIRVNNGSWRKVLDEDQARYVWDKVSAVAKELGYLTLEDCYLSSDDDRPVPDNEL